MALDERYRYSQRLFNLYVTTVKSPLSDLRSKTFAGLIEEILQAHLDNNFTGRRLGVERRGTKSMLKEISLYKKNPKAFPITYTGSDAKQLSDRDEMLWAKITKQWELDEDQHISIRAVETEIKSLQLICKLVKLMEGFTKLKLSSMDDAYLCSASNALLKIIQNNNYEIDPVTGKLIKTTPIIHF